MRDFEALAKSRCNVMSLSEREDKISKFSPIGGGLLYQLLRRARLAGATLEYPERRVLLVIAITWVPLLCLTAITGRWRAGQGLQFLPDIETHVRLLVAVPVLVFSERNLHQRIQAALKVFLRRGIIPEKEDDSFQAAVGSATRARNSVLAELALVLFVYTAGHWAWVHQMTLRTATWYALPDGDGLRLTPAGYWDGFVSVPIAQFVLFRWYLGFLIWCRLLFRISRLDLCLAPLHPDRAGGIGFLAEYSYAFGPILFAQGAVLSGVILSQILYAGQALVSFKATIAFVITVFSVMILAPLIFFAPKLISARRAGLAQYGKFAMTYAADFQEKWVREGGRGDAMLGTTDIQSLADLANSYAVVKGMRIVPFSTKDILRLAWVTAIPMLPLLLTMMSVHDLIDRVVKMLFF